MDAATEPGVGFAASSDGGYILPGFLPAFDAAAALVKLLELLARDGRTLSDGASTALPRVHLAHETVVTPWEQKGLVMRTLVEQSKDREVELDRRGEGPPRRRLGAGPARPRGAGHPHLGRGATDAEARQLAQEYVRRIRQMLR